MINNRNGGPAARPASCAAFVAIALLVALTPAAAAQAQGFAFSLPRPPSQELGGSGPPATPASPTPVAQEEQDAQSKALDSTATQWSFQLSYQNMPTYHMDMLDDGSTRAAGSNDYIQLRAVIPIALSSFTILPRVTLRHYENAQGQSGIGNTEIFALIIPRPFDWGTGRFGVGPAGDPARQRNRGPRRVRLWLRRRRRQRQRIVVLRHLCSPRRGAASIPLRSRRGNPTPTRSALAPILNYSFGSSGWYVGNGDMVALYDWDSGKVYLPIGVRFGKVLIQEQGSWNIYGEYQTSLIYKGYPGPAVKNSIRVNVSYTIPVG